MRSADAQIGAMRLNWPRMRLCGRSSGRLRWRGIIQPVSAQYEISILYGITRHKRGRLQSGISPRVTVINPLLGRREANPSEPIPHVYENHDSPNHPILCLYHPERNEWNDHLLVALTIIPWAAEWLTCYEIWHAMGEWVGGGAHPEGLICNDRSAA